jgi:hypothetical protein
LKKNLKVNGKKNIKNYHKAKGHKAANEIKIEDLNKSKTFRAVEKMCDRYLS